MLLITNRTFLYFFQHSGCPWGPAEPGRRAHCWRSPPPGWARLSPARAPLPVSCIGWPALSSPRTYEDPRDRVLRPQLGPTAGKAKAQCCPGGPGGEERGVLPACSLWRGHVEDTPWSLSRPSAGGPSAVTTHPGPRVPPLSVHSRTKDLPHMSTLLRGCSSCFCEYPLGLESQFLKTHQAVPTWSRGTLHLPEGLKSWGR